MFFLDLPELSSLEDNNKWEEATTLLYEKWMDDRENVDILCRLVGECWYILCDKNHCEIENSDTLAQIKTILEESTNYGISGNAYYNERFLTLAGYCISMFPFFYYEESSDSAYLDWEQKGKNMLKIASEKYSGLLARTWYLGSQLGSHEEYNETKKLLRAELSHIFSSKTALERYFLEVLTIEI